jgi:alkane 1-monooxygenase
LYRARSPHRTGASLLEVVNYLEHYGLKRPKRADGSYERCRPEHS